MWLQAFSLWVRLSASPGYCKAELYSDTWLSPQDEVRLRHKILYCLSSTTESSAERGKTELCWPRSKYNTFHYSPVGWNAMATPTGPPMTSSGYNKRHYFPTKVRGSNIYPSWPYIKTYREDQQRQKLQDDTKEWMKGLKPVGRWTTSQTLPREIQVLSCIPSPTLLLENRSVLLVMLSWQALIIWESCHQLHYCYSLQRFHCAARYPT